MGSTVRFPLRVLTKRFFFNFESNIATSCNNLSNIVQYNIFKKYLICSCCLILIFTALSNILYFITGGIFHGQTMLYAGGDESRIPLPLSPPLLSNA